MFVRALAFSLLAFTPLFGYSANIVINPIGGFSDATGTSPIGGNPGLTLGAQRLNTFQKAADILETFLDIQVDVKVDASFSSLACSAGSAVLGSAGATGGNINQANAPLANTIYPVALANNLALSDINSTTAEISATFNADIDNNANCLNGVDWYYGYDDPTLAGAAYINDTSFLSVVIHELLHGLGVSSWVQSNGALNSGFMDAYSANLYDQSTSKAWSAMNDSERLTSMTNTNNLVWTGSNVNTSTAALALTDGINSGKVEMYAPSPYEGGSSVSHFSTAATPNEIMEPSYTEFLTTPGIATQLLQDIGWAIPAAVNSPPIMASIGALSSTEDNNKVVTLSATDADSDAITFSASSDNGSVSASVSGTTLTLIPDANYFGTANITVTANDGTGAGNATDTEVVTYTISSENDLPVFTSSASGSTQYGSNLDVTLSATDVETSNVNITFAVQSSDSSKVTASISGSTLTLAPVNNYIGDTNLTLRATDTDGGTTDQSYVLTISAIPNTAPVLTAIGAQASNEDTAKIINLAATDGEGDSLMYSATSDNASVTASISGATLTLTPAADYFGSAAITVSVSDGSLSDTEIVTYTISSENDLPVFTSSASGSTQYGDSLAVSLSATDIETVNSSISFSLVSSNASQITASISGSTLTLIPVNTYIGDTTLTLRASDGNSGSTDQSYTLTITPAVNDAPIFTSSNSLTTLYGNNIVHSLTATDADLDGLSFNLTAHNAAQVSASLMGSTLTLQATNNFTGNTSIEVSVDDGSISVSQTINLTIYDDFSLVSSTGDLSQGASLAISNSTFEFSLGGGDNNYSVDVVFDGQDSTSELLILSAGSYFLAMPESGAFAGDYTITITDSNGETADFTIQRPLKVTTNIDQLISNSVTQEMYIEGAPAGSILDLHINDGAGLVDLKIDNAIITQVEAPDNANSFNRAVVKLHVNDASTTSIINIDADSAVLPAGDVSLTTLPFHDVALTVTDLSGIGISTNIDIDDDRFVVWGLNQQLITDNSGTLALALPTDQATSISVNAENYQARTVEVGAQLNQLTLVLELLENPMTVSGSITTSTLNFVSESPTVQLIAIDGSVMLAELSALSSDSVNYSVTINKLAFEADKLTITIGDIIQEVLLINNQFDSTINIHINALQVTPREIPTSDIPNTEEPVIETRSTGGGSSYLLIFSLLLLINYRKRKTL
jgi:hypothetical protein